MGDIWWYVGYHTVTRHRDCIAYYEDCKDGTCCRLGNEHPDRLRTSPERQVARLNVAFVHARPYTHLSHRASSASSLCSRFPFFPLAFISKNQHFLFHLIQSYYILFLLFWG